MTEPPAFDLTLYPDPVLRKRAEDVVVDEKLPDLVAGMLARMYASSGVGLAAPQVGLKKRVLVLNPEGDAAKPKTELVLINPLLVERSGPNTIFEEGCLSFPGIYAEVERPDRCVVRALDVEGRPIELALEGYVSRIVQHEYDHLEGVLLVDRMSAADRTRHRGALEALVERFKRARAKALRR
jgi:peptide deformylase